MRFLFLILLFALFPFLNSAVNIRCTNPEYAGQKLDFYRYSDPVTNEKEPVFSLVFDQTGKGTGQADIEQTTYAFCDFGIYRGMLFVEPGGNIEIKLPPLREKSFADEKNPYFSPVSFWIATTDKNQLTNKVSAFDQKLNLLTDKHFNELYFQQSKIVYDSVVHLLETGFPETSPAAFQQHKELKIRSLQADIFRMKPERYSELFNTIGPEYWLHPAFLDFFDKTFGRQLSFVSKTTSGKGITEAVARKDLGFLLDFVKNHYKLSGKMAELVMVKMLHDGFYSREFSNPAITAMMQSERFAQNPDINIRTAARNSSLKFSFLQKGTTAPAICLDNLSGEKVCTDSGNEKFKYIVFADVEMIVCREHLKYLTRIDELFGKHLEIFVVLRDTGEDEIRKFFEGKQIPGAKMIDNENRFIEKYRVRSFPQCYLFDEGHRVVFSDTKAPLDGFEQQFGTWLRNELFMRQRNQSR